MIIEVKPLEWIIINNKNINFHISSSELMKILWNNFKIYEEFWQKVLSYNNWSLQFSFESDKLVFIEIMFNKDLDCKVNSLNIFEINVDKILASFLNQWISYRKDDPELWYSYIFNDLELILWRTCIPKDNEEELWENDYEKWIKFSNVWIWTKWTWSNYNFD